MYKSGAKTEGRVSTHMNTVWSAYIQKIDTLYSTRQLRFSEHFKEKYLPPFALEGKERI